MALTFIFILLAYTTFAQQNPLLFRLAPSTETGIDFNNQLFESDTLNILNQANIYNGGGVGIGDFNQDGLMDIYFAGNMVSNKLYLNKGNLKFKDITEKAKVNGQGHWSTGISVVDINSDGWPDIYVSASFRKDPKLRTNLLYINKGTNKKGIPIFQESAVAYGLADNGYSTQAYFFDYDNDGDLDLYQVTNEIYDPRTPIRFRSKLTDGSAKNTDRLYRNNGNNTFTNVSKEAGITIEGWGHAASITDINSDGWPDIYVANDFISNDILYINNKNGTFTNRLDEYFKHTGWNAMGTDIVDFNNDGLVDVISLEMLPENNLRKKRMLSGNEYYNYINNTQYNYNHQYVRNVLQVNSGQTPNGHPVFNDVGFMAGVFETDWSWCPLAADFDNDGFRDLIITNGLPRDVTDLDYIAYGSGQTAGAQSFTLAMTDSLPVVKLANYAFKNINGINFENKSKEWGLDQKSFSNGGIYADLDNDGDLDIVVNNINDTAFVYENTLKNSFKHLTVSFKGPKKNPNGIGAIILIRYGKNEQFYEHYPSRGYLSSNDPRAHFAFGNVTKLDTISVVWPSGKSQIITNVTDNEIVLDYQKAKETSNPFRDPLNSFTFQNVTNEYGINFKPIETDFADYNIQPTLPHKLSQYGPGIAVGDIDNNGFDDFYVGGSSDNPGVFFMQDESGQFIKDESRFNKKENILYEDMGVLFFDADNDNDLDLYLVSGSYEIPAQHAVSNDRFFLNDGKGYFQRTDALPQDLTNGSCVKAADFDGDGDLDLFVGGRVISAAYPLAPDSFLLRNDDGKFTDVTKDYLPELQNIGMVTDALWSDFDMDGRPDLILSGEWMPVTFLRNTGNTLTPIKSGLENQIGWWNSLTSGDFDNDGDIDYVAGNLGLNTNYKATPKEPMTIIAKDIDQNGSMDAMVFCYMTGDDGKRKSYPIASRDDLVSQVISMRKKYNTYKSYGLADMDMIWNDVYQSDALVLKATEMRSSYIENKGNGKFEMSPLPFESQQAPIFGMQTDDIDGDGNLDILMVGNDYGMDPYSGRHDAFTGLYLKGNGKGNFKAVNTTKSGFFANGDAKGLVRLHTAKKEDVFIVTQNQDSLLLFTNKDSKQKKWIDLKSDDFSADIEYTDGKKRRVEFYYGSTFLSQSTRKFPIEKTVKKITITNFKGSKREVL
ncbi:VCBS repeat-containing protein [Maribacter confluentis]|uniref:VCBS repeat-containing protein n=1 Tax=Maribacter confluentis TaxID=1656093 RepID=A0ABT8RMP0_9FLAO|nr:VCBS repeat-containing protein [Maribacter confluentis]MDO1512163.1 VCBS repeat-containing protein [Maribacter confluentis]